MGYRYENINNCLYIRNVLVKTLKMPMRHMIELRYHKILISQRYCSLIFTPYMMVEVIWLDCLNVLCYFPSCVMMQQYVQCSVLIDTVLYICYIYSNKILKNIPYVSIIDINLENGMRFIQKLFCVLRGQRNQYIYINIRQKVF